MSALAFLALAASLALADDKKDGKELRGTWTAVGHFGADGKLTAVAEDDPRHFTFEFGADKLVTKLKKRSIEGTYKLDPSKSPRQIDVVRRRGGEELTFKGIYAVEKGRLKVCLAGAGNDRPKEFKAGKNIEFAVELKRVEK
jgi:uncharacterized protein (TIGR03067 family)